MSSPKSSRFTFIFACVLILLAIVLLAGTALAATRDEAPHAWSGRLFGFVSGASALAIGALMARQTARQKPHYWGMVGALALGTMFTGAYSYEGDVPPAAEGIKELPMRVGRWQGQTIEQSPETRELTERILMTSDIVMRRYQRSADTVVDLAVVHSESDRRVAHPPEHCYTAAGDELLETGRETLEVDGRTYNLQRLVLMSRFMTGSDPDQGGLFVVLYWYRAGGLNTPSFLRQQVHVMLTGLNPLQPRGMRVALIRLSMPIQRMSDVDAAVDTIKDLASELIPHIEETLH